MRSLLRYCKACGEYTLRDTCPKCGKETHSPVPPRFSPEDRHSVYRRRLRFHNE